MKYAQLSATMLSDNAEKTKNPLKKAMRRRNAKTVQFAAPTYVEPSDYEYSSDEDNGEHEHIPNGEVQTKESIQNDEQEEDATATVEPLKLGAKKELKEDDQSTLVGSTNGEEIMKDGTDEPRTSNEIFDRPRTFITLVESMECANWTQWNLELRRTAMCATPTLSSRMTVSRQERSHLHQTSCATTRAARRRGRAKAKTELQVWIAWRRLASARRRARMTRRRKRRSRA